MSQRREQIRQWLENTDKDDDWLTKTYQEISDEISQEGDLIALTTIRDWLPLVVADKKGIAPSEVLKQRQEYRKKDRRFVSQANINLIREWRTQENPVEVIDIAYRIGVSPNTVRHICRENDIP